MQGIDDRFDAFLGGHQIVERAAAIFVELGGHVVERFGHGFEFSVAGELQPFAVIVVGDFADALFQFVDRTQNQFWKPDQNSARYQYAQGGHDDQPPHDVVGTLLHIGAFRPNRGHVDIHNAQQVLAHGPKFLFGDRIAQCGDVALEFGRNLFFTDLGDVLLLQSEVFAQGVARY